MESSASYCEIHYFFFSVNRKNSDKDCGTPVQLPQDKKKRGYCECCEKKYEDLQTVCEMSNICFNTVIFLKCGINSGCFLLGKCIFYLKRFSECIS